jgi:hypothetical protein
MVHRRRWTFVIAAGAQVVRQRVMALTAQRREVAGQLMAEPLVSAMMELQRASMIRGRVAPAASVS